MIRVSAHSDGAKNVHCEVVVSDTSDIEWTTVVDLQKLNFRPKRVRIDEIYYALSDKVEVQVAWHHPAGERYELLPLAGRGRLAFNCLSPSAPKESDHSGNIEIRTIGLQPGQLVYLMFDLTKQ